MSSIEDRLRIYYDREMSERAGRPLGEHRESRLVKFIQLCREQNLSSVVEIGCGAGRDGKALQASGLQYAGLDFSSSSVGMCRSLGLEVVQGSALALPFGDDQFDAAWTMSTLMHLPAEGLTTALSELARVVRSRGVVEVGVWGADEEREWSDAHGRYFYSRTDHDLQALLGKLGDVTQFDTWSHLDNGAHYQWARVTVG